MKIIKRLAALSIVTSIGLSAYSCMESEDYQITSGYIPAQSFKIIPDSLVIDKDSNAVYVIDSIMRIDITYILNKSCYKHHEFQLIKPIIDTIYDENNEPIIDPLPNDYIGTLASKINYPNCKNQNILETKRFEYKFDSIGDYKINVWKGKTSEGKDIFETQQIKIRKSIKKKEQ